MFELFLLLYAKRSHDSYGILFLSFSAIFLPLRDVTAYFFFFLSHLLDYNLLKAEVKPMRNYMTNENSHLKL